MTAITLRALSPALGGRLALSSLDRRLLDPLVANPRARHFYERLGFRFVENRRFGDDDCAVYALDRAPSRPSRLTSRDAQRCEERQRRNGALAVRGARDMVSS